MVNVVPHDILYGEQEPTVKLWKHDGGKYNQVYEGEDAVTCWMYADREMEMQVGAPTDIEYKNEMGLMVQSIISKQNEGPMGISYNDSVVSPLINDIETCTAIEFWMIIPESNETHIISFEKNQLESTYFSKTRNNDNTLIRCFMGTSTIGGTQLVSGGGEDTGSVLKITPYYITLENSSMSSALVKYPLVPDSNSMFFRVDHGNTWPSYNGPPHTPEMKPYLKIVCRK